MAKLKCRRCKRPLRQSEAVYLDQNNNRTKRPACPQCYHDIVRHATFPGLRSFEGARQRRAGTADSEYHGGYREYCTLGDFDNIR
jgi:hypothetical protein